MARSLFSVDTTEMSRAIATYAGVCKKDLSEAINKKLGWILRRALWYTHKADYYKMARSLNMRLKLTRQSSRTRSVLNKRITNWRARGVDSKVELPLIVAIIQSHSTYGNKASNKPKPSPYRGKTRSAGRAAMRAAVRAKWGARASSIAWIRSGWTPAFNLFKRFASGGRGLPPTDAPRVRGAPKGSGYLAAPEKLFAEATNRAVSRKKLERHSGKSLSGEDALRVYGGGALQRAFNEELADTYQHINDTLYRAARGVGIAARR